MRWGVVRWKDKHTRAKLTRQTAAAKKNLKSAGKRYSSDIEDYDSVSDDYRRALSKSSFSRKKKDAAVREAGDNLTKAGDKLARSKSDLDRAERLYDNAEKQLKKHVDGMVKKYGKTEVKSIKVKDYDVGSHYVKEMVKTGITLADIPLIGTSYTGRYVGKNEYSDRLSAIESRNNKDKW